MKKRHRVTGKISAFLLIAVLAVASFPVTVAAELPVLQAEKSDDSYKGSASGSSETGDGALGDMSKEDGENRSEKPEGAKAQDTLSGGEGAEAENPDGEDEQAENLEGEDTETGSAVGGSAEAENQDGENIEKENIEAENMEETAGGDEDGVDGEQPSETAGFTSIDPATGIKAEADAGIVPAGAVMIVTPVVEGEDYELFKMLLKVSLEKFRIYDISFFDMEEQAVIQPAGKVRTAIPVPEDYDTERIGVYHIGTDGQKTELAFTVEDGYAVFETDHFSLYAIGEKKEETTAKLPPSLSPTEKVERIELQKAYPEEQKQMQYSGYAKIPKTGDESEVNGWIILMAAAVVVIGVCVAVIIRNRKK